jgi:hypothetical protein
MSLLTLAATALLTTSRAEGGLLTVDFSTHHNLRIQDLEGSAGQFPEGDVVLSGVPFAIPAGGVNAWSAAVGHTTEPVTLDIAVNIFGVDRVHTLINTFWGEDVPGTKASLTFLGSAGASFTLDLDGNDDVRDYIQNVFTNTINGTTTVNVFKAGTGARPSPDAEVRLDMLTIDLPPGFLTQTLTTIRLTDTGVNDGFGPDPQRVFLTGITVSAAVVPEPSTLTLISLGGLVLIGGRYPWRRRSRPPARPT